MSKKSQGDSFNSMPDVAAGRGEPPSPSASPPSIEAPLEANATIAGDPLALQIEHLKEQLAQVDVQLKEHKDKSLRALAETENVRRRAEEEISKGRRFALEGFATEMLPAIDSLEKTLATQNLTAAQLYEGVEITLKQLQAAFSRNGLVAENPVGRPFNPNVHQAIGSQEDQGEPNRVLNVLQKGYSLNGRVVRPALVIISIAAKPPAPPASGGVEN